MELNKPKSRLFGSNSALSCLPEMIDTPLPTPAPGSDELWRVMVESITDYAIFSMDRDGLVTTWNSGATKVLGFSEREIMGKTADVIFTAEDRVLGVPDKERNDALTKGRAVDERWQIRKGGARFWASGLLMPLADPRMGFVKILRDRTEAHEANVRLRANEERFRLLATNIPQLVFRSRPDGHRTWGSPQWIEFTGLDLPASLGYGWLDAIHPDDLEPTRTAWETAMRTGEYYVEHRVRRVADGQYRWHQTRAKPVESGESPDWVGTMTDIHDLKHLQDMQGVLLAELQHRTRNMLALVQAIAVRTIGTSVSLEAFATQFAERLRAIGRVQGLLERNEQLVGLRDLIETELAAHRAREHDRVRLDGPPILLTAEAVQTMGLALHELTTNAVKYGALATDNGHLAISWQLHAHPGRPRLRLVWKESGVEIPAAPERRGYGSTLIEKALPYQLDAETRLDFEPDGVRCVISVPVPASQEHV